MTALGLELVYNLALPHLTSKQECIILALHTNLLNHGFRCLHSNEEQQTIRTVESELLPNSWNSNPHVFELQYSRNKKSYLVKAIAIEGINELIITLMSLPDESVHNLTLNIDEWVSDNYHSFQTAFKNITGLFEIILQALILPALPKHKIPVLEGASSATSSKAPEPEHIFPKPESGKEIRFPDPFSIGIGDLDPLAGGQGGGMLMDPRHQGPRVQPGIPGNFPAGAVPPGARFDPFGPPPPEHIHPLSGGRPRPGPRGGFGDPDPDHLPPPPGSDDMFM